MSEFNQAMQIVGGNLGLHVIQFPSKKFGFVGSVPMELGYEHKDGSELIPTPEIIADCKRMDRRFWYSQYNIKTRVFSTLEAAVEFATARGYQPKTN